MWGALIVLLVHCGERGGATRGGSPLRQVAAGVDPLARAAVVLLAFRFRCSRISPPGVVLEMKQQPDLKTRVRDRQFDIILACKSYSLVEVRMVPRPLDIEDTPVFVHGARPNLIVSLLALGR